MSHLNLPNRVDALAHATRLIAGAWQGFDHARPGQPGIDNDTRALTTLPLPQTGMDPLQALDDAALILDQSLSPSRPRYFAFVGSSGLEMGVLADALASCYDVNLATHAAAASMIERQALRWVGELIGFPNTGGAFTSGGMLSNLTALSAARERALPGSRINGLADRRMALYASRDAHTSVARAVEVLGFGRNALRDIALDERRRMDPAALARQITSDRAAGITPIAIVANAGTTLSGAVDPIQQIADIAARERVWLHIDGAYGAPAAATGSARPLFAGITQADSITIDAHKWLYLPKACGVLLVKDRGALTAAFGHEASYIPHDPEIENPVEWTLEYSRPFRALKLWLALRTHGAQAFRGAIEANLAQARLLAGLIRAAEDFELLLEPQLSTVLFRHLAAHGDPDMHNRRLVKALQEDGRVYLSGATVDGRSCLRACFVNYRTQDDDVRAFVDIMRDVAGHLPRAL